MLSLNGSNKPTLVDPEQHPYVASVCAEMQPIQKLVAEISATDIPVLLEGESGTGKEVVALEIHRLSSYKDLPFVKLSCAALRADSLKGQIKHLSEGSGNLAGTIFLDEIGELDSECQRFLLHSIPDGHGASMSSPAPTGRIVSSSAHEIEVEAQNGTFRSELFYRLNGVCLRLPPLRKRREDIPILVNYFLGKYAALFKRKHMQLSNRVMTLLNNHAWPGNIRQLETVVKRIVALSDEELAIVDLEAPASRHAEPVLNGRSLKAASRAASMHAERALILETLERTHWNRKRAAEALQISYKSLLFKLKHIEIPGSEKA